jgi:hypothetical protein
MLKLLVALLLAVFEVNFLKVHSLLVRGPTNPSVLVEQVSI